MILWKIFKWFIIIIICCDKFNFLQVIQSLVVSDKLFLIPYAFNLESEEKCTLFYIFGTARKRLIYSL